MDLQMSESLTAFYDNDICAINVHAGVAHALSVCAEAVRCRAFMLYMTVREMCVCVCVSLGGTRHDKSPLTLSCLTAQIVFAQWINHTNTHTHARTH